MSLETIVTDLRTLPERIIGDVRAWVEPHAAEIERAAADAAAAAQSPIALSIANALHVPAPVLGKVAELIDAFEAHFVAVYGQGHQDGQDAAAQAAQDATAPAENSAPEGVDAQPDEAAA